MAPGTLIGAAGESFLVLANGEPIGPISLCWAAGKTPMEYEITIDDPHGIAELRFLKPIPHSDHVRAREELLEVCRARKIHKILVDARKLTGTLTATPTTMDLFDFGASWADLARRYPVAIAGVLPLDTTTRRWWKLGETVAVNRGVISRAFDDLDQAKAWLRVV